MKRREITNNELEQLFNNIIELDALLTEDQVVSLISLPSATKPGNTLKRFFQSRLNTILLSSTILIMVTIAIFWYNSGEKAKNTMLQNNQQENVVVPDSVDTNAPELANIDEVNKSQNKAVWDTVVKESNAKPDVNFIKGEKEISLSDIYKHYDKKPQVFTIQANRDTTIICKEGTKIKISANSFISENTGKEISGTVKVALKEYYKISDIILSGLTTTSGGKILETGGMLHISAKANNENCIIKKGCKIEIGFPYSGNKEDMALFYGEQTNNFIDWKSATPSEADDNTLISVAPVISAKEKEDVPLFFIVEDMPEFLGGEQAMRRFLKENAVYPASMLNKAVEGKVTVTFVVDSEGNTTNIRVVNGFDETLDKVAVYAVSNFPLWKPGRQRGRPVNVSYTIPVIFSAKKGELSNEELNKAKELEEKLKSFIYDNESTKYLSNDLKLKEFEEKIRNENYKETSAFEVNRYLFSTTKLGWLNCDRFLNENRNLTDLSILNETLDKTIVNVIFHRFKSLIPGNVQSDKIVFRNIPEGEKVSIVAVKAEESEILFSVKEIVVTGKEEVSLEFHPVTFELLKKEMEKLNKFY